MGEREMSKKFNCASFDIMMSSPRAGNPENTTHIARDLKPSTSDIMPRANPEQIRHSQ
jgi:hypothetical protein